jgi:hypothetical protein
MFDVSLFSQMEKTEPVVYFNESLDVSSLKILYDNCIRMGSEANTNVSIATAHPDLWFGEYFDFFKNKIKMIVKNPVFQLIKVEGNQLVSTNYSCDTIEFLSDNDLKKFFDDMTEYGSVAVFSLVKYVDIKSFSVSWRLRYKDVSTKEETREKKIKKIIE